MSIGSLVAAAASPSLPPPTTLPSVAGAAAAAGPTPPWVWAGLCVWAAAALAGAAGLGAFRRRGIVGPERLAGDDDPAGSLVAVLGGGIVALFVGTWLANAAVHGLLRATRWGVPDDVTQLLVGGLGEAVFVAVVLLLVRNRRDEGDGLRLLGVNLRRLPTALAGGTAALFIVFPLVQLAGLAVAWVWDRLCWRPPQPHELLQMMGTDHRWAAAVAGVVTAAVVAPVAEELFFRGLLQTALGRGFDTLADRLRPGRPGPPGHTRPAARWAAVVVTSAAFAAVHGVPAFLAPIFVLSLGLGFVYERSGNLWMSIVTHALFNAAQIAFFFAPAR